MHQKIQSIQLLRAVAVGLVVFVHATSSGVTRISTHNFAESFFYLRYWGALGVDLFFAISGFIMTIVVPSYQIKNGWKKFLIKRLIRIVPLYYLLSIIELFISVRLHHHIIGYATILKSFTFFPLLDGKMFESPIMFVGWSLSYEMYFYLIVSILLSIRGNIYRNLIIIISAFSIIGVLCNPTNALLRFLFSPLMIEFGFGVVCGMLYKKMNEGTQWPLYKKIYGALSLVFIGVSLLCISIFISPSYHNELLSEQATVTNDNVAAFVRVILWGIPTAIILLGILRCESVFKMQIPALLILSGDASYSCYLIHAHCFPTVATIFGRLSLSADCYLLLIIPICIGISIIFYKLIEKPLTIGIDKLLHYRKPAVMQ